MKNRVPVAGTLLRSWNKILGKERWKDAEKISGDLWIPGMRWRKKSENLPGMRWRKKSENLPGMRWRKKSENLPGMWKLKKSSGNESAIFILICIQRKLLQSCRRFWGKQQHLHNSNGIKKINRLVISCRVSEEKVFFQLRDSSKALKAISQSLEISP